VANEKYFGDLDAVVGDGDFGYSMARGFEIVLSDWDGFDRSDISTFLKKVAVVITSRIGGTSGPIWGTGFLRAGTTAAGAASLEVEQIVAMLRAAIEGIKARGGAELGEKTLLDALVPATDTIETQAKEGSSPGDHAAGRGGHRAVGGGGDAADARQARTGRVHGRAQHRHARRGCGCCRRSARGAG